MSHQDELLFGTDRAERGDAVTRDSDGDGVSDVQEQLDGTDPNDANQSIRHDLQNGIDPDDPRGDLRGIDLEGHITVDVTTNIPAGKSVEQSLPMGMDGKAIPVGGSNHYGNADADKFFDGHAGNQHSPLDMKRDPMDEVGPRGPSTQPGAGTGSTIDSADGSGSSSTSFTDSGHAKGDLPPGVEPSGTADPGRNMGLVSAEASDGGFHPIDATVKALTDAKDAVVKAYDDLTNWAGGGGGGEVGGNTGGKKIEGLTPIKPPPAGKMPNSGDIYTTNPDADQVGGAPTQDEVERAIAVRNGATDLVRGAGAPHIEGDAPRGRPIDLVTDGNPDDNPFGDETTTVTPPEQGISKPVNPADGLGPTRDPSAGTGQGGGSGGDHTGRLGVSSAATATEADADADADPDGDDQAADSDPTTTDTSGVTNIGTGATSGTHSIGTVDGDGTDPGDATQSIRHDALDPIVSGDPRGDLRGIDLEGHTTVDVTTNVPDGKSVDQSLPTGLDGKAIPTGGSNHSGNADADAFLGGHSSSQVSPLDMQRDPMQGNDLERPAEGRNATTDTLGREAGPGVDGELTSGGDVHMSPLPDLPPSGSADPDGPNRGLVSEGWFSKDPPKNEDPKEKFIREQGKSEAQKLEEWQKKTAPPAPKLDTGDGDGSDVVPSEDDVARAVAVHDGATDVVRGHDTPQIEGDAPPGRPIDLVTDGNPDTDPLGGPTAPVDPPGQDISKPVNPADVLGGGGPPPAGPHSVAQGDVAGMDFAASSDGAPPPGGGSTIAAGDDDDLEELEVERYVAPDADAQTGTHGLGMSGDDLQITDQQITSPFDPVADAMGPDDMVHDVPDGGFSVLEVDHALAVPDEVDLDDGF